MCIKTVTPWSVSDVVCHRSPACLHLDDTLTTWDTVTNVHNTTVYTRARRHVAPQDDSGVNWAICSLISLTLQWRLLLTV